MTVGPNTSDFAHAYAQTYRGPHGGAEPSAAEAAEMTAPDVAPTLIAAHERLAHSRRAGETLVEVYGVDHSDGFGPALQIVTDQAAMVMDSVTVLLHRLGVAYVALMHPTVRVRRDADGTLVELRPAARAPNDEEGVLERPGSTFSCPRRSTNGHWPRRCGFCRWWSPTPDRSLRTLRRYRPPCSPWRMTSLPMTHPIPRTRPHGCLLSAAMVGRNFVLLGALRCTVGSGTAVADGSGRLGVARLRTEVLPNSATPATQWCWLRPPCPVICATAPTPTSWWCVSSLAARSAATRETPVIEHRFVGLFTIAAMNANVLDIPMISRRVQEALAMAGTTRSTPVSWCSTSSRPFRARSCSR